MITLLVCLAGVACLTIILARTVFPEKNVSSLALAGKVETSRWAVTDQLPYYVQTLPVDKSTLEFAEKTYSGMSKSEAEHLLDWLENQPECPNYELECVDDTFTIHFHGIN